MGYGRINKVEDDYLEPTSFGVKIVITQALLILLSLTGFAICIWIRFDLDFWEWVEEIQWYTYWNCMYVVMFGTLLKAFVLALGGWSILQEQETLLLVATGLHFPLFVLHVVGAAFICVYGVEESKVLISELHDVFLVLVYNWDTDPRASRILRIIQEYVGCCGASGGDDYLNVYKEIPVECRHPITGCEWGEGCEQAFAWWLESWTVPLAGISCVLAVSDVIMVYLYLRYRKYLRAEDY